jgi:DNA sulfur modification protein DndD
MNFKALELEDFGIYSGLQQLNLSTKRGRPIILVGGTNGAGKTTLLEAFTLCLHGKRALGPRVARQTYEAHIGSRFHVVPDGEMVETCAITLSFEHVQSGRGSEYLVSRRWHRESDGSIKEVLTLKLDGEEMDDLSEASRQDFLDSLLPPGLAGFFLFDGEQIQALADDENGEHLADAVKRLLGLDLVEQLQTDLKRFAGRASSRGMAVDLETELATAEQAVADAKEQVALAAETRAILTAEQDQLDARVTRVRDQLAREGGVLATERASVEKAARAAAAEISATEEQLRAAVAGLLPFAICRSLAEDVAERLEVERTAEEDEIIARRISAAAKDLRAELSAKDKKAVTTTIREVLGIGRAGRARRIHDVSAADRAVMLEQLHQVEKSVRTDAKRLAKRLRRAHDKGERSRRQLEEIPDDEALGPFIEQLQALEYERGELSSERERLEEEMRQAEHELRLAERDLRRVEEESTEAGKGIESAELAWRTIALLRDYGEHTELRRLEQIELEATRYFNRLSRKGELLSRITIDRGTFRVRVIRWDQTELPKERLSAGEKQLLAIAILWALAQASKRPLPVVVDTPLARLDREHRRRLLTEYLPHVSHQVIVLSTDTEVDLAAAAELQPVTARKLFLSHDLGDAATAVEEGYFSSAEEAVSSAG